IRRHRCPCALCTGSRLGIIRSGSICSGCECARSEPATAGTPRPESPSGACTATSDGTVWAAAGATTARHSSVLPSPLEVGLEAYLTPVELLSIESSPLPVLESSPAGLASNGWYSLVIISKFAFCIFWYPLYCSISCLLVSSHFSASSTPLGSSKESRHLSSQRFRTFRGHLLQRVASIVERHYLTAHRVAPEPHITGISVVDLLQWLQRRNAALGTLALPELLQRTCCPAEFLLDIQVGLGEPIGGLLRLLQPLGALAFLFHESIDVVPVVRHYCASLRFSTTNDASFLACSHGWS